MKRKNVDLRIATKMVFSSFVPCGSYLKASGYKSLEGSSHQEEGSQELPALLVGECHVWSVFLDQSPSCVEHLSLFLSPAERSRGEKFYNVLDARRFIVARALLRILLGCYVARVPNDIEFNIDRLGKPSVEGLQFSKSASAGLGLFAFSRDAQIGVDLEAERELGDLTRLAEALFSALEREQIASAPSEELLPRFFRGWTRKEAVLKALGVGLTVPPNYLSVSLDDSAEFHLSSNEAGVTNSQWSLRAWTPALGYQAALAIQAPECQVAFYRLVAG